MGRMKREVGTEAFDLCFGGKVSEEVCKQDSVWVCVCAYMLVIRVRVYIHKLERTHNQRPDPGSQSASVADKLQGLAGTSGAQVALSIQDPAHWSVVWVGAGANSWTLALSAPHQGGGRRVEVGGDRLATSGAIHRPYWICTIPAHSVVPLPPQGRLRLMTRKQSVQHIYYNCLRNNNYSFYSNCPWQVTAGGRHSPRS